MEVTHAFPDHHPYTRTEELAALRQEAETRGLLPVTTEKDLVRIAAVQDAEPWPEPDGAAGAARGSRTRQGLRNLLLRRINERRLRVA